jgi:hypothetical protein
MLFNLTFIIRFIKLMIIFYFEVRYFVILMENIDEKDLRKHLLYELLISILIIF